MTKTWDRHAILAEVKRQNKNLTTIAVEAGLYSGACRAGMIGSSKKGAMAIADAIGVPFRELFPDSYTRGRHNEEISNRNGSRNGSAKSGALPDKSEASA